MDADVNAGQAFESFKDIQFEFWAETTIGDAESKPRMTLLGVTYFRDWRTLEGAVSCLSAAICKVGLVVKVRQADAGIVDVLSFNNT